MSLKETLHLAFYHSEYGFIMISRWKCINVIQMMENDLCDGKCINLYMIYGLCDGGVIVEASHGRVAVGLAACRGNWGCGRAGMAAEEEA